MGARLGGEVLNRWPHIRRYLHVRAGRVEDDYLSWYFAHERVSLPSAEVAAAYEEWAEFHEWELEQRADELAGDYRKRNQVERWTDDMAYSSRRCAAFARGEDPGEPVPLSVRRPDLEATFQAIVAEIVARVEARRQPTGEPAGHLRKAG